MKKAVVYIHGAGGSAAEAEHYKPLFDYCEVIGFDYKASTPWEARAEFGAFFELTAREFDEITVVANSLGAYFVMQAPVCGTVKKAYFISPVVDMEKLITAMMAQNRVTEDELREKGIINIPFGESLRWDYLCYVRNNPVRWSVPTEILYGEKDNLTSFETVSSFASETGAGLEVMKGGEHWFHTAEQMEYLDKWLKKCIKSHK